MAQRAISAKCFFTPGDCGKFTEKNEHRTSNIERPTSNVEWEKMKKQETEELVNIFYYEFQNG